jgi:hypothetical protein
MYIYLDESYNLKDRRKPQFISINGFMTVPIKKALKRWKEYRRRFAGKWRIHATDSVFEPLRKKSFHLVERHPEITVLSTIQIISEIPAGRNSSYYKKEKLNFDKVYEDMLRTLFEHLQLDAYKEVVITVDNRKTKEGMLGKQKLQEHLLGYLAEYYPSTRVEFRFVPSASDILLEVADFISNTFYRHYIGQEVDFVERVKSKTIQLKNPLK